jgi:hypothetical protein
MVDTERLEKTKERAWSSALGAVITVSVILLGTLVWLFWPYPRVTSTGTGTVSNLDSRGYFETGDVIRWTTPEVCQPEGRTDVTVQAILDFAGPDGAVATSDTLVVSRSFDVRGFPECVRDNPTTAYVDGNLPSGTYRFEVRACVQNPTPRPKCDTFPGPTGVKIVRIAGNEPTPNPVP